MKSKKNIYSDVITTDLLIKNCHEIIAIRYVEINQQTNFMILSLFWKIGNYLNSNLDSSLDATQTNKEIEKLSDDLSRNLGDFFSFQNVSLMRAFADICTKDILSCTASFISWNYIPAFLNLRNKEEWIYYASLLNKECLDLEELEKRILDKFFLKNNALILTDLNIQNLLFTKDGKEFPLDKFFTKPLISLTKPLLTPISSTSKTIKISKTTEINENDIISNVMQLIKDFQINHNAWLNTRFNLMFYDIGKRILEMHSEFNTDKEILKKNLSKFLRKNHGILFSEKQLTYSVQFAQLFDDSLSAVQFASHITWEQILFVLSFNKNLKASYYSEIIELNNLNNDLKSLIKNNFQDKKLGENIFFKKSSISGENGRLSKNKLLNIKKTAISINSKINIFENKYFMKFINSFDLNKVYNPS